MFKFKIKLILFIFLSLALTACGFELRGKNYLPPELRYVYLKSNNPSSSLTLQLNAYLRELGVTFVNCAQDAPVTLVILSDNFTQSGTTIGTAEQINTINITYTVVFALHNRLGQTIYGPVRIISSNSYLQSATQILGDTTAIPAIQQGLIRDIIQQITAHLHSNNVRSALFKQH